MDAYISNCFQKVKFCSGSCATIDYSTTLSSIDDFFSLRVCYSGSYHSTEPMRTEWSLIVSVFCSDFY